MGKRNFSMVRVHKETYTSLRENVDKHKGKLIIGKGYRSPGEFYLLVKIQNEISTEQH